eukprot:766706-Hanusia_phi.AAC.5
MALVPDVHFATSQLIPRDPGVEISHSIPFMIINLEPGRCRRTQGEIERWFTLVRSPAFLDGRMAIGDVLMAVQPCC